MHPPAPVFTGVIIGRNAHLREAQLGPAAGLFGQPERDDGPGPRQPVLRAPRLHDAFGRFKFQGLRQKFWLPFEVEHRLGKAGFRGIKLNKVLYPWDESLAGSSELASFPPSWDWFFLARRQAGSHRDRWSSSGIPSNDRYSV